MLRVKHLLKRAGKMPGEIVVLMDGRALAKSDSLKGFDRAVLNRGVFQWDYADSLRVMCNIVQYPPHDYLTVSKLCGICTNKSLMLCVDGGAVQHIYSAHPVKDSKLVRKWWVEHDTLHIRTWPCRVHQRTI